VINPNRTNRHGDHPGYKLVPGAALPALFDPAAPVYQRAPVIGERAGEGQFPGVAQFRQILSVHGPDHGKLRVGGIVVGNHSEFHIDVIVAPKAPAPESAGSPLR